MYQIKRHENSRRIIYKIGVLNEKRCKNANYKGGEKKYCFSHRKNGMINQSGQVCKVKECNKMASLNYDNCKNRIYCACHKKPFMIN